MTTRDKDGNPVSYCTGMCNIIRLISLTESGKLLLEKLKTKTLAI